MVQRKNEIHNIEVFLPGLYADGTLPASRQHDFGFDAFSDTVGHLQAYEPRSGENDGIEAFRFEFVETGFEIAAHGNHLQVRAVMQKLGGPPETAGSHPGAFGQVIQL